MRRSDREGARFGALGAGAAAALRGPVSNPDAPDRRYPTSAHSDPIP